MQDALGGDVIGPSPGAESPVRRNWAKPLGDESGGDRIQIGAAAVQLVGDPRSRLPVSAKRSAQPRPSSKHYVSDPSRDRTPVFHTPSSHR